MTIYVVSHIMDCDNQWVTAVFTNRCDAVEWVRNQEKDDDEYSVACGSHPSKSSSHEIDEFEVRQSPAYSLDDVNGLRLNYEKVLRKIGFVPGEDSNYKLVVEHQGGSMTTQVDQELRDRFAMAALAGLTTKAGSQNDVPYFVALAYKFADVMLEQRQNGGK